jgi:hypothetical protein
VDAEDAGRPAVQCSAKAVYFVEATANCTLSSMGYEATANCTLADGVNLVEATANCTLSSMGYASMGFRRGRESAMGFAAWIHCKVLHHAGGLRETNGCYILIVLIVWSSHGLSMDVETKSEFVVVSSVRGIVTFKTQLHYNSNYSVSLFRLQGVAHIPPSHGWIHGSDTGAQGAPALKIQSRKINILAC